MLAVTDRRAIAAAVLLASLTGCGGSSGAGPETRPPAVAGGVSVWEIPADPAEGGLASILNAESAVEVRIGGVLTVDGEQLAIDLLLHRSGAMRLEARDGELVMVSDGARLLTRRGEDRVEEAAWRPPTARRGRPDLAISPFDLGAALLPAPWPDLVEGGARVATARTPEGTWVSLLDDSPGGDLVTRRRALVRPADGVVAVRESYDADGAIERVVEWLEPGRLVEIRRPRAGSVVRLRVDALEREPARDRDAYRVDR